MINKERLLTLKFIKIIYSLSGNANHIYDYIAYNRVKFDTFWKKNLPKPKTKPHLGGKKYQGRMRTKKICGN